MTRKSQVRKLSGRTRSSDIIKAVLLSLGLMLAVTFMIAPVAFAQTANTYTDTSCATAASSFNAGTTVYGGASALPAHVTAVDILYVNPSNTVTQTSANVAVSASGAACDSAGYAIPSGGSNGDVDPRNLQDRHLMQ